MNGHIIGTWITVILIAFVALILSLYIFGQSNEIEIRNEESRKPWKERTVVALVTGYNTVPAQTDSSPCVAASGENICGKKDAVACPMSIPLGTVAEIDGQEYRCVDRTNTKYNGRFDISCDKDFECPYLVTGYKTITLKNY